MSRPARLRKALRVRKGDPFQQHGQKDDARTRNGATGCTDTVLQYLLVLWLGKHVTHDQIRTVAGVAGAPDRGLRPTEVQRVCDHYGLPYQVRTDMTFADVLYLTKRGPVGFGHAYNYWPEQLGKVYAGRKASGRINGFAQPLGTGGATQIGGVFAHFGIVFGVSSQGNVFGWEPNHGSPARPERPAYEWMERDQFERVFESYQTGLGRGAYALIPTRSLPL